MKVIGITSGGSVIVEMHAKQVRELKATAERLGAMALDIPDIECGDDGVVKVLPSAAGAAPLPGPVVASALRAETGARAPKPLARSKPASKTLGARRCTGCGKEFVPVRKDQTCCNKVCRRKYSGMLVSAKRRSGAASRAGSAPAVQPPDAIPPKLTRLDMIKQAAARVAAQQEAQG
jgi:hypothetical protein